MESRKLALPLLAFAGGAILGRLLGLKTLMRGAMTAAAVTGLGRAQPALLTASHSVRRAAASRTRKTVHRSARKKTAQRKSPRIVATHG